MAALNVTDNNTQNRGRTVVAAVNDLMFGSKVRGAAEQLGVRVVFARSSEALHEHAAGAGLVLLDLDTRWLDVDADIRRLKTAAATSTVAVVAFGSHLQTETLTAARTAGADRVMARSAFVKVLPELLRGLQ
ncbi:hypothetical protein BH23GEM10_BH23GEM10_15870 [soil metagenome]